MDFPYQLFYKTTANVWYPQSTGYHTMLYQKIPMEKPFDVSSFMLEIETNIIRAKDGFSKVAIDHWESGGYFAPQPDYFDFTREHWVFMDDFRYSVFAARNSADQELRKKRFDEKGKKS